MNGRVEDCSKEVLETENSRDEEDHDIASDYSSTFDFVMFQLVINTFSILTVQCESLNFHVTLCSRKLLFASFKFRDFEILKIKSVVKI